MAPIDNQLRWFALWTSPGPGSRQAFDTHKEASSGPYVGHDEPPDVVVKTTLAELRKLHDWARTF